MLTKGIRGVNISRGVTYLIIFNARYPPLICRIAAISSETSSSSKRRTRLISGFDNMKGLILIIALLSTIVRGQTISPCFEECLTLFCPDGVNDPNCFCVTKNAAINKCANTQCDPGSIGDGQMIQQKYCTLKPPLNGAETFRRIFWEQRFRERKCIGYEIR